MLTFHAVKSSAGNGNSMAVAADCVELEPNQEPYSQQETSERLLCVQHICLRSG